MNPLRDVLILSLGSVGLATLISCGTEHVDDKSDVGFGQLATTPTTPIAGLPFTLQFTVVNNGSGDARHVVWILARDGIFVAKDSFDLVARESESPLQSLTLNESTPGTHSYEIVLDPSNEIPESNEGNNRALLTVVVAPGGAG